MLVGPKQCKLKTTLASLASHTLRPKNVHQLGSGYVCTLRVVELKV